MTNVKSPKEKAINSASKSGFPLQTAIAHLIGKVEHCSVATQEFPWGDEDDPKFLDIVAWKAPIALPIECKKTSEAWTFLCPFGQRSDQLLVKRCIWLSHCGNALLADLTFIPKSHEAAFCATSESAQNRLLEKQARELLVGGDSYAWHLRESGQPPTPGNLPWRFLPLIVTTATLYALSYDPTTVSLETGELPKETLHEGLVEVPWVRFCKSFTTGNRFNRFDPGERTVIVVNAQHISRFLRALEFKIGEELIDPAEQHTNRPSPGSLSLQSSI